MVRLEHKGGIVATNIRVNIIKASVFTYRLNGCSVIRLRLVISSTICYAAGVFEIRVIWSRKGLGNCGHRKGIKWDLAIRASTICGNL